MAVSHRLFRFRPALALLLAGCAALAAVMILRAARPADGGAPLSEGREPGAMEPTDWFFRQRAFPHGAINPAAFWEANEAAERLRAEVGLRGGEPWQFAGPINIGGRVTSLAVGSPLVFYAGTGSGGVFQTIDGGASFMPVGDDVLTLLSATWRSTVKSPKPLRGTR